jgi:hypothetical protein
MVKFERLVRFEDSQGAICYGEVLASVAWDADLVGVEVETYSGEAPWAQDFALTGKKAKIAKVSFTVRLSLEVGLFEERTC